MIERIVSEKEKKDLVFSNAERVENTRFFVVRVQITDLVSGQRTSEPRLPFLQHTCFLVFVVCIGSVWYTVFECRISAGRDRT